MMGLQAYLAMGLLAAFTAKMYSALRKSGMKGGPAFREACSPLVIALGVYCMYRGRRFLVDNGGGVASSAGGAADNAIAQDGSAAAAAAGGGDVAVAESYLDWTWTFWLGESIVMTSFVSNSVERRPPALLGAFVAASSLLSLWLRGRFWRYATLLGFEGVVALLVVMAFPVMEMILESIVDEKMRKVGEKIRAHDRRMKELLRRKRKEEAMRDGQ